MKKVIATLLTTLAFITSLSAQLPIPVNYAAGNDQSSICFSDGTPLQSGTVILGTFPPGSTEVKDFTVLDTTSIREIFGQPGKFAKTAYFDHSITGVQLWWIILDEETQQCGIFSCDGWVIPEQELNFGVGLYSTDVNQTLLGSIEPGRLLLSSAVKRQYSRRAPVAARYEAPPYREVPPVREVQPVRTERGYSR